MGIWGTVIAARLYFLHVVESATWTERAVRQQRKSIEISPRRGVIYDRNNNELAISIKVDSVFAVPDEIKDPVRTARTLSSLTGMSRAELVERLDTDKSFVWIKRKISPAEANAIQKAKLTGVYFQKEDQRFYPKRELAAHVLGYVNIDEEGMGGLEFKYNDSVRGEPGRVVVMTDARRRDYYSIEQAPAPGANLVTTIDQNIQYIVEKELKQAQEQTQATGISIVAMDPRTGEILAMANYPQFNPNEYRRYSPGTWTNRSVSHTYEPGSTFKIVTIGAALEEKLTTPGETIDCQMGSIVLYGHRIRDHLPFGLLTVQEVMKNSSDVGAIKLGMRLGDQRFASYISRLGFGRLTSVDLPGEERGLTKPANRWSRVSVGAISMGQEIGVTPLQIVSMVSAVANGGILYRPFVVKQVKYPESGIVETDVHGERVLSTETTSELREMLEIVVTEGTAKSGRLEGYTAAGKTGTAQKIDETGRYSKSKYVASFAGFAPATNPVLSLIVVIDEPRGRYHGGEVAAPVFKRIAEQALHYMSVPADVPLNPPQFVAREEKRKREPSRPTVPAMPGAGASSGSNTWKVLDAAFKAPNSGAGSYELGEISVPEFYGKSLRQVTEQCLRLGLRCRSVGSGAAAEQFPPAGANVRAGSRVQVRFTTKR